MALVLVKLHSPFTTSTLNTEIPLLTHTHFTHTHTQLAISNKLLNFYKIELKMISKNLIKKA